MIKTESDFLKFAFHYYDNPHLSSIDEFESDIKRFVYLNNLINRYITDKNDLKDRLIINHIVILCNCFSVPGAVAMLDYKIIPENKPVVNAILYYMGIINDKSYMDNYILEILNAYK